MKKLTALILTVALVLTFAACTTAAPTTAAASATPAASAAATGTPADASATPAASAAATTAPTAAANIKIGVILVGDQNVGYDSAHIAGIKAAAKAAGIADSQIIWKYNVEENQECYDNVTDLVEQGCKYIFSDSYGHQAFMQQAAQENPNVMFVSMTGDTAATSGLKNFKNAFNDTYQSRYVSGVVAGMKLQELVKAGKVADANKNADGTIKIGYIGAYPYAEVVSGYTAFYLGVKSVVDNVAMTVTYTNSWYDPKAEGEAANALMSSGCIIISQHADSTGAPSACQTAFAAGKTVYCVGYNIDMLSVAPDAALTSAQNNWSVYYTYAFGCIVKGETIATDWAKGYADGAVQISALGKSCAAGTADKVKEVEAAIKGGKLNVFDCSKFTVGGQHLTTYTKAYGMNGAEAIKDGVFQESIIRSAPYFDLRIDGIKELNAK